MVGTRRSARFASTSQKTEAEDDAKTTTGTAPKKPKKKQTAAKKETRNNKRGRKAASAPPRKKRTGLKCPITDTSSSLGVVDPESKIEGRIQDLDGHPSDVMLALVDPVKHMDKFYIIQLIKKNPDIDDRQVWVVYTRWGRTGTVGQASEQEFEDLASASKCFTGKFEEKTGLNWEDREEPTVGGKYRFVKQDFVEKQGGFTSAKWQYWVDDGVDGKTTNWYDYDAVASCQVERLYLEHTNNPQFSRRMVDSGSYTYNVNLDQMIQTNVTHSSHTSRRIRRCPNGTLMGKEPPTPMPSVVPSAVAAPTTVTPQKPSYVPSSTVVPVAVASMPIVSPPVKRELFKNTGSHPVDADISVQGKNVSDYQVVQSNTDHWYDATLNQCNIAGNNNKYYRLQMLKDSGGKFYTFFRWG